MNSDDILTIVRQIAVSIKNDVRLHNGNANFLKGVDDALKDYELVCNKQTKVEFFKVVLVIDSSVAKISMSDYAEKEDEAKADYYAGKYILYEKSLEKIAEIETQLFYKDNRTL